MQRIAFLMTLACIYVAHSTLAQGQERVELFNKKVVFVLPTGFKPMPKIIAKIKYPNANRPQYLYCNDSGTTSIAVTLGPKGSLSPEQLPELKKLLINQYVQIFPGLKWINKGYITINENKWLNLECISHAVDTDIHNNQIVTSFNGADLSFNFNSTIEEYPRIEKQLKASMQSVVLIQ